MYYIHKNYFFPESPNVILLLEFSEKLNIFHSLNIVWMCDAFELDELELLFNLGAIIQKLVIAKFRTSNDTSSPWMSWIDLYRRELKNKQQT